jgi:multiple sugar transport system substrate-binding protein
MKNKFSKRVRGIFAILIISAMLLAVGCTGNSSDNPGVTTGSDEGDGTTPNSNDRHPDVHARALELAQDPIFAEVFPAGFQVNERIRWLSWFAVDEFSPTMEVFRARFGDPVEGESPIERIRVTYENRYTSLSALMLSGDPPDIFQFEERFFPHGAHIDYFMSVCDVIDFSRPEWDATRDVMEMFHWGGKNYTAITELTNSTALLFYRNSVAQEAGLRDPEEVWNQGGWNWDAMLSMVSQFSNGEDKWGMMGFLTDEAAMLSTGIGLISIENGLLQSNMDDNRIERAMDMIRNLAINDWRYPHHILNEHQLDWTEFRNGNILFAQDGPWRNQEEIKRFRNTDRWPEDELRIVPFPRDNQATGTQTFIRGKQDAYMFVKGSTNRDGFRAWTYSALMAHQDPEMQQVNRQRDMANHGWTAHQLDVLEILRDPNEVTLVWDFKNGIGLDIACAVTNSEVEQLTKPVMREGEPYPGQRDTFRTIIVNRINEMNERARQNQ